MNSIMENSINTNINSAAGKRVVAFRSECPVDAEVIRALMTPWTLGHSTQAEPLEHEGKCYRSPDVEVKLTLSADAPTVAELRYIWDAVPNVHISADTLAQEDEYTGDREPRCPWTGDVTRPSKEVMSKALEAVVRRQEVLEAELVRMQQTYRDLRAMHDLGERWNPPVREGYNPGTICLATLPGTKLTRVIVVSPTNLAAKQTQAKGKREVETRLLVINS